MNDDLTEIIFCLAGIIMDSEKQHSHQCDTCQQIWTHDNKQATNREAHTCSNCGTVTWLRYYA